MHLEEEPQFHGPLKILHLENDANDAELVKETLNDENIKANIELVDNKEDFVKKIKSQQYDVIFADYSLPAFDGLSALEVVLEQEVATPFILISGAVGEEVAIDSLKSGATDYVLKERLYRLAPAIKRALKDAEVKKRQREMQQALKIKTEELEKANRLFAESNRRLSISNKELEQFAYVASHDLRAPLRHIFTFIDILQEELPTDSLNKESREAMAIICSAARKMDTLIKGLLKFSKVDRESFEPQNLDMNRLVKETVEMFDQMIREAEGEVVVDKLPNIFCDKRISQVFQNLIENSLKYRVAKPRLRISCESAATEWKFKIEDNGIGIPMEQNERIFKIFQRLHTDKQYTGVGIGLSICKKIVDLHSGEIWLDSNVTQGSVFYFTIKKNLK